MTLCSKKRSIAEGGNWRGEGGKRVKKNHYLDVPGERNCV